MNTYNILVVDDEGIIRTGISLLLRQRIPELENIWTASSAEEAIQLLEARRVDIVVTDISMTGMTGIELSRQVQNMWPDIHVIILTGYDRFEYAQNSIKAGVKDYLLKPVDEDELERVVKKQVDELRNKQEQAARDKARKRAEGMHEQLALEKECRNLLQGESASPLLERLKKDDFDLECSFQIIILYPKLSTGQRMKEENLMTHLMMKETCIGLFDMEQKGVTFEDDDGRICLAVFCRDDFEMRLQTLKTVLKVETQVPFVLLAGGRVENITKIRASYREALELQKEIHGRRDELLLTGREIHRSRLFQDAISELQQHLEESFGDKDTFLKGIHRVLQCIDSYSISDMKMRQTLFLLTCDLMYEYALQNGKPLERLNEIHSIIMTGTRSELAETWTSLMTSLFFSQEKKNHQVIQQAKVYIQEHLADPLSVMEIAESMYVSVSYFSRLFKSEEGLGCNEYIMRQRMKKAEDLLDNTNLKINEIAGLVGYKDMNYFSLAFRKFAGVPPTEYRMKK